MQIIDDRQLAQLMHKHNLVSKEKILQAWKFISPQKNLIHILREHGEFQASHEKKLEELLRPLTRDWKSIQSIEKKTVSPLFDLFSLARSKGASDVFLTTDQPLTIRKCGILEKLNDTVTDENSIIEYLQTGLPQEALESLNKNGDWLGVVEDKQNLRYRVHLGKNRNGVELSARLIPEYIRNFEQASLPQSIHQLMNWKQGMILITGPAGCGKTSTLATLVQMLNDKRDDHIIMLEKPIEYKFSSGKCRVTQRELGLHTNDQHSALRAALRQDPDIIVISDMGEPEIIRLAITAAETGHLVLGTMNTANASRTIYRLIDSFPADERDVIRAMISESLRGIVSQQLIPLADQSGMTPAYEILGATQAVANLIRKDDAHQLGTAMVTGRSQGMVLLEDSVKELLKQAQITPESALKYCPGIKL